MQSLFDGIGGRAAVMRRDHTGSQITQDLRTSKIQKRPIVTVVRPFLLIGLVLFCMAGTSWGQSLQVEELNIFQSQQQLDGNQVTINFRVHNNGAASHSTFKTTISGLGAPVIIDTASVNGKPSIGAGETLYFGKTLNAPSTGSFTVDVSTDDDHANKTSSIDAPPLHQWYWVGPTRANYGNNNTGRLLEVVLQPGNPNIMYTRGEEAAIGIWKTSDAGSTWSNISLSLPNPENTALAIHPNNAVRVFALSSSDGLYRSENGGVSWQRIAEASTIAGSAGNPSFVISPKKPQVLFFAPNCMRAQCASDPREGVYRSTDGGYTWTSSSAPYLRKVGSDGMTARPSTALLDPNDGDVLYASLQHSDNTVAGVYRTKTATHGPSSDWNRIGQCAAGKLPGFNGAKPWLAFTKANPATLYVLIEGSPIRLFKSTGTCTSNIGSDISFEEIPVESSSSPPLPLFAFTVNPVDSSRMFVGAFSGGSSYTWRSQNEGRSWAYADPGHPDLKSFTWDTRTAPATLFAASDGGLHKSGDNGESWSLVSGGVENVEFYHVAQDSNFGLFGGTQDNGNLQWERISLDWAYLGHGDGGRVAAQAFDDIQYITDQYPDSLVKRDHGTNVAFNKGLPADTGCRQPDIHVPVGSRQVYVACRSLYWSPDEGDAASFAAIFMPPSGKGDVFRSLYDPFSRRFFVGTTSGEIFATSGIPDAHSIWTNVFSAGADAIITDLGFGADPIGTLFISTNRSIGAGRVYRLTTAQDENGRVLLRRSKDITFDMTSDRAVNALANHAGDTGNTVYAGTSDGVYLGRTSNGGNTYTWTSLRDGMGRNVNVTGLILYTPPGTDLFLAATTYGRSAFVTRIHPF
jgi:photosystem II stability/assembly factor-like uncharacterized protein